MKRVLAAAWHFGLDLGQRKDHSAIVVVESQVVAVGGRDAVTYEPATF